jgi:hypothetical protein
MSQALVVEFVIAGEMLLEVIAPGETLAAVVLGAQRAVDGLCSTVLGLAVTLERVQPCERPEADAHEWGVSGALLPGMQGDGSAGGELGEARSAGVSFWPQVAVESARRSDLGVVASRSGSAKKKRAGSPKFKAQLLAGWWFMMGTSTF